MPKIFVPCRQAMTVRQAREFGDLIYLHDQSDPGKSASPLGLEPDRIFDKFARPLNTYEPGDMILLDGPLVYNTVAASMLACLSNTLTFLIWHRDEREYRAKSVSLLSVRKARSKKRAKKPTVYSVNKVHATYGVEKYGDLVITSDTRDKPTNPEKTLGLLSPVLKASSSNDFFMLSGDKLSNAIASIVLSRRHTVVTYLLIHHRLKRYLARSTEFTRERIRKLIKD